MVRTTWMPALILAVSLSIIAAAAADLDKVNIRGVPFTVTGSEETGFIAAFHETAIHLGDTDDYAHIRTVVSGGGRTYVIIAEGCNGTACSDSYRVIDVTTNTPVSAKDDVTPGYSGISDWKVRDDGAVDTILKKGDGLGTVEIIYKDGALTTTEHPYAEIAEGPAEPPGGDYSAYAVGHKLSDVFRLRALQSPLKASLSPKDYEEARHLAFSDFGSPFIKAKYSDMVYASGCQPHDCNSRYLALAYRPDGHLLGVLTTQDGRRVLIGAPSEFLIHTISGH